MRKGGGGFAGGEVRTMSVAGGKHFSAAVTEHGKVAAWGQGDFAQLGLGCTDNQLQPVMLSGFEAHDCGRILLLAAGQYHTAALVEDGRVYTWGGNSNGQLGHDDEQPRLLPTALGRGGFGGAKVVVVACGTAHTMAVTAEGGVWTCGRNADGQLGHGGRVYTPVFTRVASSCFDGERIVMGACGDKHSIVASEAGRVWTWGAGGSGRLGHNSEADLLAPAVLPLAARKIVTVAAGHAHTLAVGDDGVLVLWGEGTIGQLGLGDLDNRLVPTCMGSDEERPFGGSGVKSAACGFYHTLVVTWEGALWAFGEGWYGRLGLGDDLSRLAPVRVEPQHFNYARVATAAAGALHSMAVTEDGALYTWGKGSADGVGCWAWGATPSANAASGPQVPGGLGHGDAEDRLVPTLVSPDFFGGARVGRCNNLPQEHALAFAMGTHVRLGAATSASCRECGPLPGDLVRRVVEACSWRAEGGDGNGVGEGVVRLIGGRKRAPSEPLTCAADEPST